MRSKEFSDTVLLFLFVFGGLGAKNTTVNHQILYDGVAETGSCVKA